MNRKLKDIILREDYPRAFRENYEKIYKCKAKGEYELNYTSFGECKNCAFREKLNDLKKRIEEYPSGRFGNCSHCPYGGPYITKLE